MIIGEIKRFIRDGNSLRVSRSIRDTAYLVLKTREKIETRDEVATLEKIAAEMRVAQSEVVYALDAISDPVSLYEPVYNKSGDALLLMDQLADTKNTDEAWTEHVALREAMGKLSEREKKILFLRYFEGKTQTEISSEVGISQAQVSRLEKTALKNIRTNISWVGFSDCVVGGTVTAGARKDKWKGGRSRGAYHGGRSFFLYFVFQWSIPWSGYIREYFR